MILCQHTNTDQIPQFIHFSNKNLNRNPGVGNPKIKKSLYLPPIFLIIIVPFPLLFPPIFLLPPNFKISESLHFLFLIFSPSFQNKPNPQINGFQFPRPTSSQKIQTHSTTTAKRHCGVPLTPSGQEAKGIPYFTFFPWTHTYCNHLLLAC